MAPSAVQAVADTIIPTKAQTYQPLSLSGALGDVDFKDITPAIGREFPKADLTEWLSAPNSDELLRDLAITSKPSPLYSPFPTTP